MSVEKFIVTREESPYTNLPNKVLQGLQKHIDALGLWCSLASLPPAWEFYKNKICEDFNIGRDKLKRLFDILEKCNLIEIRQLRDEHGKYGNWSLRVKNGADFVPFTENTSTVDPPFTEKPLTAEPLTVDQSLVTSTYKYNNKKTTSLEKKHKSFYDNSKKHDFAQSMDQMACEKRNIAEHEGRKSREMQPMPDELRQRLKALKKGCIA